MNPQNTTKSALEPIARAIAPELRELNDRIMLALSSPNDMMNGIVREYLQRKGKQIRPIVVILSARLFSEQSSPKIISAAASVEMLHNASLIHDDVVDESQMRRNEPTINGIWDNHIAVLVGDFFTSTALQMAAVTEDLRIIDTLAALGRRLSKGELNQIYNARYHHLSEEAYFNTIDSKTASLFVACAEMGAYSAGINDNDPRLAALRLFAKNFGLCFQITDDIFDYYPREAEIGKPTGNDLREGKVTLPLLSVLLREDAPSRDMMLALVAKDSLNTDEINRLTQYAIANGGIDYARAKMAELSAEAEEAICGAFESSDAREALLSLLQHVINRDK
ncbi:MAG: polyprenyl synthetase family protein [Bacteroides sp.]|nr:polyprenyl synthetase family protein [Bacteroides sp.]MCM1379409.1 polyprenyl synthetase family protein [Bacteroides sp.]MCM1445269.1 polyprenyl synthetase family protein [Prevotella sp.]